MDFSVGHLLYMTDITNRKCEGLLRVVGTGNNNIQCIEYTGLNTFGSNEVVIKLYSFIDGKWYKWGPHGGIKVNLKKICIIVPTKVPELVRDFLQMDADSFVIKGLPYKKVDTTNLSVPQDWVGQRMFYLKGKTEAVLYVQSKERETLHDRGAIAQLLTPSGTITLHESDVWMIKSVNDYRGNDGDDIVLERYVNEF